MRHAGDKRMSKSMFLAVFIVFFYLAFFGFDVSAAYEYTVEQAGFMLEALGF